MPTGRRERPRELMTPDASDIPDAQLVAEILGARSRRSVEAAYRTLLDRYWRVVVVLLRSRVSCSADAEDLAQEAFIRAWRALPRLEHPERFLGWLLRIARNLATDHRRGRPREASLESLGSGPVEGVGASAELGPLEKLEQSEETRRLLEALGELPERYRTALVLRYLEGLSGPEMARRLGEPEGTLRNRIFRALGRLRRTLAPPRSTARS